MKHIETTVIRRLPEPLLVFHRASSKTRRRNHALANAFERRKCALARDQTPNRSSNQEVRRPQAYAGPHTPIRGPNVQCSTNVRMYDGGVRAFCVLRVFQSAAELVQQMESWTPGQSMELS